MQASFANTVTGQREAWLVCVGGFAACKVCRKYGGSRKQRQDLALGTGTFTKLQNILRHGNATKAQQKMLAKNFGPQPGINWDHELAVQQWCREEASALVPDSGVVVTESVARDRRSACIHVRTLLETHGVVVESGDVGRSCSSRKENHPQSRRFQEMLADHGFLRAVHYKKVA